MVYYNSHSQNRLYSQIFRIKCTHIFIFSALHNPFIHMYYYRYIIYYNNRMELTAAGEAGVCVAPVRWDVVVGVAPKGWGVVEETGVGVALARGAVGVA